MAADLPVALIADAGFFTQGYLESRFSELLERAEVRRSSSDRLDDLVREAREAEVVICRRLTLNADFFTRCAHLMGVTKWGVGIERIDVAAATDNRVVVANSPGNFVAMAEATLLLMLALSKDLARWVDAGRHGKEYGSSVVGCELEGKTLGIVGWGRIGHRVTGLCQALGMKVIAYDPYVPEDEMRARGVEPAALDELMSGSDVVSLNPVLTPETRHMIGERELRLMKSSAFLVNTSRGPVVDEAALYRVLEEGVIRGAGLDVFEVEPLDPKNPLLTLPNVVATPHSLGRTAESADRTAAMLQQNALAMIDRRLPEFTVNPGVRPKWLD